MTKQNYNIQKTENLGGLKMKLTKNLICLTLASCVAHASVASQATLTKDLVIKSTDEIVSDSKSDPISDAERDQMQNMDGTLKTKLELLPIAQEGSVVTQTSEKATFTTAKEKRATEQNQKKEEKLEEQLSISITDGMEECAAGQLQETSAVFAIKEERVVDQQKELSANSDLGALSNDGTMTVSVDAKEKLVKGQEPSEVATASVEQTKVKAAIEDESATEQKQSKEEITKVQSPTVSDDQEKNVAKGPKAEAVISSQEKNSLGQEQKAEKISEGENGTTAVKDLEEQRDLAVNSQEIATRSSYTDKKYAVEALNLIDPYIYHLTKVTQNFRFCDGSKEKISINNLEWRYQDDEGKGSANYMKLLFPSNAGELNTDTSAKRECFSSTCHPTAELIADMECYFHNYVRNIAIKDKAQSDLNELVKKDLTFLKKVLLQTEAKNLLKRYGIEIPTGKRKISEYPIADATINMISQSEDKSRLIYLHNQLNPKNQISMVDQSVLNKLRENIKNGTFDYLPMEHFVKFDKGKNVYDVDSNSFKMVLKLLNEGSYMIKDQESDGVNPDKILPKYMTERMLMTYFFLTKSEESDITKFYSRVKEKLGDNIVDPGSAEEALEKLSKRAKMVQDLKFNDNSPYKVATLANASTYGISKVSDDRHVTFQEQTFPDCADIATRHVINLLMYDKENQWSRLLNGVDRDKFKPELEKILKAIEQHKSVEFKTLKERLQIFFLYQESVGADAADISTRSLWNYVISNMNQEQSEGLYQIEYAGGKNYELVSGFDNSLKILYNIACALDISSSEKRDQAKKAIDDLMKKENHENETKLGDAINAVYKLFNENIEVSETSQFKLSDNKLKWIGKVVIKSDTNSFEVEQTDGHTRVIFDPVEKYDFAWIEKNKDDVFKDEIAMLLLGNNVKTTQVSKPLPSGVAMTEYIFGCDDPKVLWDLHKELCDKVPLFYKIYADKALSSIYMVECKMKNSSKEYTNCFEILGHKNYISNFKALKFLKGIQNEQNNKWRVLGMTSMLDGIDFDSITLKYKIGKQDEKLGEFIINNYLLKNGIMNPAHIAWGETLRKINPDNVFEYDGVEYYCLVNKDNVTLYPCKLEKTEVLIPAKVNLNGREYKVVALGICAFYNSGIKKIAFEAGIEDLKLSKGVFAGCANLEEINFADSIKKLNLEENIFFECKKLQTIHIPELVSELNIGDGCFIDSYICEIKMPAAMRTLHVDKSAFYDLNSLHTFELNDGLEELQVEAYAFRRTSIGSFKVPSSVTNLKISDNVFANCEQLKELVIPEEKEGIEVSAEVRELSKKLKGVTV